MADGGVAWAHTGGMLTCPCMHVSQRAEADEMEAEGEVRVTLQQLEALG